MGSGSGIWSLRNSRLSIGERILVLVRKRRITQDELSEKTGLNRSTISRVVKGYTAPRTGTLLKIAKVLRVTISDLCGPSYVAEETVPDGKGRARRRKKGARVPELLEEGVEPGLYTVRVEADMRGVSGLAPRGQRVSGILVSQQDVIKNGDLAYCKLANGTKYVARVGFKGGKRGEVRLSPPGRRAVSVPAKKIARMLKVRGLVF